MRQVLKDNLDGVDVVNFVHPRILAECSSAMDPAEDAESEALLKRLGDDATRDVPKTQGYWPGAWLNAAVLRFATLSGRCFANDCGVAHRFFQGVGELPDEERETLQRYVQVKIARNVARYHDFLEDQKEVGKVAFHLNLRSLRSRAATMYRAANLDGQVLLVKASFDDAGSVY